MGSLHYLSAELKSSLPIVAEKDLVMVKDVVFPYAEIANVLSYDPHTGEFTWKETLNSRARAGGRAGVRQRMQNGKDYLSVTYRGRKMSGAQVAWLLHYKVWPDRSVFFIDNDPTNLRITNLKLADHKSLRVTGDDGKVRYKMTNEQVRHYGLRRYYDLSFTQYAEMYAQQGGVCAICNQPETAKLPGRKTDETENRVRDLSVDHDHMTGAVRQLLCNACNHLLGHAKDNPDVLRAASDYLDRHQKKEAA
jgi:hypothetical protein